MNFNKKVFISFCKEYSNRFEDICLVKVRKN